MKYGQIIFQPKRIKCLSISENKMPFDFFLKIFFLFFLIKIIIIIKYYILMIIINLYLENDIYKIYNKINNSYIL